MRVWELSEQPLQSDCELPNQSGFMAWLEYQRSEYRRYRARVARRLALSRGMSAEEGERWAQRWLLDAHAAAVLNEISTLEALFSAALETLGTTLVCSNATYRDGRKE